MKKGWLTIAAVMLLTALGAYSSHAGTSMSDGPVGTWTLFVKIAGAQPCQCIQVARFRGDGTLDGPANDKFSGDTMGEWRKTSDGVASFTLAQNVINPDGSAAGVYIIKGSMTVDGTGEHAQGTSTFQVLDVDGKATSSGTATFTGMRLKAK